MSFVLFDTEPHHTQGARKKELYYSMYVVVATKLINIIRSRMYVGIINNNNPQTLQMTFFFLNHYHRSKKKEQTLSYYRMRDYSTKKNQTRTRKRRQTKKLRVRGERSTELSYGGSDASSKRQSYGGSDVVENVVVL